MSWQDRLQVADELRAFVRDEEKGLPRKIEPLPAVKPFEPFT